jgi:hypothetical protein
LVVSTGIARSRSSLFLKYSYIVASPMPASLAISATVAFWKPFSPMILVAEVNIFFFFQTRDLDCIDFELNSAFFS